MYHLSFTVGVATEDTTPIFIPLFRILRFTGSRAYVTSLKGLDPCLCCALCCSCVHCTMLFLCSLHYAVLVFIALCCLHYVTCIVPVFTTLCHLCSTLRGCINGIYSTGREFIVLWVETDLCSTQEKVAWTRSSATAAGPACYKPVKAPSARAIRELLCSGCWSRHWYSTRLRLVLYHRLDHTPHTIIPYCTHNSALTS